MLICFRDRKRIKARIKKREREKRANGVSSYPSDTSIVENETRLVTDRVAFGNTKDDSARNGHPTQGMKAECSKNNHSTYSLRNGTDNLASQGVDNLTFERSFVDIPLANLNELNSEQNISESKVKPDLESATVSFHIEKQTKPHFVNKPVPIEEIHAMTSEINVNSRKTFVKSKSSENSSDGRKVRINQLPSECLAVKKLLRRHSYEVAVSDYSWLPNGPPSYTSTVDNVDTYKHQYQYRQREKKYSLGCENGAFHRDDQKKRPL